MALFLVVLELGEDESVGDIVVSQELGEAAAAKLGEEVEVQVVRELIPCVVGGSKEGSQGCASELGLAGLGLFVVVSPIDEVAATYCLDSRRRGREPLVDHEDLVKDASGRKEGVVKFMEAAVLLRAGRLDLGVKVDDESRRDQLLLDVNAACEAGSGAVVGLEHCGNGAVLG